MERAVQIVIVALVVVAVVCILVTPDLSDDVDGVVHDCHLDLVPIAGMLLFAFLIAGWAVLLPLAFSVPHRPLDVPSSTCVRLC